MGTLDSIRSIPKDDSHSAGVGVAGGGVVGGGPAPGKGMHSALSTGTSMETKHSKILLSTRMMKFK